MPKGMDCHPHFYSILADGKDVSEEANCHVVQGLQCPLGAEGPSSPTVMN